jgi:hypothetical protein
MSSGWKDPLTQLTQDGRTIESLGPVVLGNRLNSSRASDAYRPIVYRKGAVVLAMLARAVGEAPFHHMLRSLVDAASNRVVTTEGFLDAIERMSGQELDGFARQYIYGTGIPQIYYDYETARTDTGGWVLRGEARQLARPRYRHVVVGGDGDWDLRREVISEAENGPTTLMVPFRLTLDPESGDGASEAPQVVAGEFGQLRLEGRRGRFEIESLRQPVGLRLDPRGEILAGFYSAHLQPKRFLHYRAQDLTLDGDLVTAEAGFREALAVPAATPRRREPLLAPSGAINARAENLRIRLSLVRLYLDQGRDAEALEELDEVDGDLDEQHEEFLRVEREVLRGRLEIRRGEFAAARQRLKRVLRWFEAGADDPWSTAARSFRVASERQAVAEAYALLAIAAHASGRQLESTWAAGEAESRGVDVSRLGDGPL